MDVAFVTSNSGKLREARSILGRHGLRVRPLARRLPELQADSLEEVVRYKLLHAPRLPIPVLVEDSGLFVRALRGFPGVYSAYALRTIGLDPIVDWLNHRGGSRAAEFRTVAAVRTGPSVRLFVGVSRGSIARRPRGRRGFGFDPIFVPRGDERTYGEMDMEEKNRRSHRAQAMTAVARALSQAGGGDRSADSVAAPRRAQRRKEKLH